MTGRVWSGEDVLTFVEDDRRGVGELGRCASELDRAGESSDVTARAICDAD